METLLEKFGVNSKERVENALLKLQQGKGILLVDDENRENEGDIIFPLALLSQKKTWHFRSVNAAELFVCVFPKRKVST